MIARRLAALVALGALLVACTAGPGAGGEIEGIHWVLRSYEQAGTLTVVPDTIFADAEFDSHRVSGLSGCNSYQALFQSGDRTLLVSMPSVTLMACDPATMAFEQTYLSLLQASRFYGVQRDTLTVWNADRTTVLVFDAAPRNPMLGRWQVDSFATGTSSVSAPISGTALDVTFGIANIGGFAGCNSFNGTYGTNGNIVRISRLASTRIACAQDVMDQETAFLAALQGASFIDYRGSTLLLEDRNGRLQVALVRPTPEPEASPSLAPSAGPSAAASPSPTSIATSTPSAAPTPSPTPTLPAASSPPASSAPGASISLPIVIPPIATCDLAVTGGPTVAKIAYPGAWFTVVEPANLVCHYFDPAQVTVPADPTTLQTAVTAAISPQAYADAVAAATDPANWTVNGRGERTMTDTTATCVDAVALTAASGLPVGTASFACLADVGTAGTVVIRTTAMAGDPAYRANSAVVALMTAISAYQPQK